MDISSVLNPSCMMLPPSFLANLDYVITVCEQERCSELTPEKERLRWSFPDPYCFKENNKQRLFALSAMN